MLPPPPSVWEKETFFGPKDVIIIGSGLVGLWSAYFLKKAQPSCQILILERGLIPTGASTRNAGFACFGSVTELLSDARKMGEEKMLEQVAMRYEGLKKIRKVFSKKEIELEKNGGYELINNAQYPHLRQLKNDIGWLNHIIRKTIGEQKVFRLANKKIKNFGFDQISHLIESPNEAQLHSGKLVQALLQKIQGMGVQVFSQIEVIAIEKINGKLVAQTNLPFSFTAEQVLVCTNAFARQLLPSLDVTAARGQVIVSSPIKKLAFKGCFHFDEGYYYFRNLGNRVLLGGARNKALVEENSQEMITTDRIQLELERFLKEVILPKQSFTIDYRWSGIMGLGGEKSPIIREIKKNIFCAVRMSGIGVAIAPVVGETVARKMLLKNGK
jgi:gamma-glutamylputrescine oxidase